MVLLLACCIHQIGSTQRKFDAFLHAGANISQIDGDKLAGFDKAGLNLGIGTGIKLNNKTDLHTEFIYSQRGAASSLFFDAGKDIQITMNYVDIPVTVTIKDWKDEEKNFFKVFGKTGLQYSRLINSSTNFIKYELPLSTISNYDVSFLAGFGYNLNKKVGIEFRYTRSLRRIQNNPIEDIGNFKIYYWTFRGNYYL